MKRLAIETATETCSVALFENDRLIAGVHELVGRGHAERLIPMIAELPDQGRADEILVDCGPGSFTGVRVGLAAARALGFAWTVPVRGYSSLALIAATAFARDPSFDTLAVTIIGGHGEYFVQRFERMDVRSMTPFVSLSPDRAVEACGGDVLVGSGAAAIRSAGAPGRIIDLYPDASNVVLLPDALASLPPSPIYGRSPDARLPG